MAAIGAGATGVRPEPAQRSAPPLWREYLWPVDWLSLRLSPVYYGIGVPRGDGSPVVLVPGFMGTDLYLGELYLWLRRIGYRPYMSGIGVNADCPDRLTRRLLGTMERAHDETGRPVRLIGHSLGGVLARAACSRQPHLVSHLIYLGAPVQALKAHPAIMAAVAALRATLAAAGGGNGDSCFTEGCGCGFGKALEAVLPGSIQHGAIYSRRDGVVDWRDTVESDSGLNHEVGGTHLGLVVNPRAYRVLALLMARGSDGGETSAARSSMVAGET